MPLCFKSLKACFQGMNNGITRFQLVLFPCLVILHVQCWSRSHMDGACQLFTMLVLTNFIMFKFFLCNLIPCFQGMNNGITRFQLVLFPCLVILHVQCWSRSHMDGACQLFTMLVLTNFITMFQFFLCGLVLQIKQWFQSEKKKNETHQLCWIDSYGQCQGRHSEFEPGKVQIFLTGCFL